MVNYTGSLTDPSANGWGFGTPKNDGITNITNGQAYGIEAFGGITPGQSDFTNSNGSSLQGFDYGIVGKGYVAHTGNSQQLRTSPFEQTAEVFTSRSRRHSRM